jgi:hypothetical protein
VKPERGEQADDSLGDLVSRLNDGGVLGSDYFWDCFADERFSAAPTVPQLPEFMS